MEIRRLWAEGVPAKELASRFGVSPRNIRAIVTGKLWRHVPLAPDLWGDAGETQQPLGDGEDEAA